MYLANSSNTVFKTRHEENCAQCIHLASYCRNALNSSRQSYIECNSDLFELVELSIQIIHYHGQHSWAHPLLNELYLLNKELKESMETDRIIPILDDTEDDQDDGWDRAIRISIYHCRASLYEPLNVQRAIEYYRKCLCVCPSKHTRPVQQSARLALEQLSRVSLLPSRTSSVSSQGSICKSCSYCGKEKRGMPVCSRCKSQYYCSVRCLKEHKLIHALECNAFK